MKSQRLHQNCAPERFGGRAAEGFATLVESGMLDGVAEWAVSIDTVVTEPAADEQIGQLLDDLKDAGAAIAVGDDRLSVTLTAVGADAIRAGEVGSQRWRAALLAAGVAAGIDVAVEILEASEQDRRLASPA